MLTSNLNQVTKQGEASISLLMYWLFFFVTTQQIWAEGIAVDFSGRVNTSM